ncbi:MAG: hypothetical protein ACT4P2_02420 [Pseudomonadota bacterium]
MAGPRTVSLIASATEIVAALGARDLLIARSRADLPALAARPGWAELGAVKTNRIYLLDGNQHFNRSGPWALAVPGHS